MNREHNDRAIDRGGGTPLERDHAGLRLPQPRGALDQLRSWFERDLVRPRWDEVRILAAKADEASIEFSTRRFTYAVHAVVDGGDGYLGCTCTMNDEQRGRDLPDGPLAESTWLEIHGELVEQEGDDAIPVR